MAQNGSVTATLNYVVDDGTPPEVYTYKPDPGVVPNTPKIDRQAMTITSVRDDIDQYRLDEQGFMFVSHRSALDNFWEPGAVEKTYYDEVAELVRAHTGASEVMIFDHNLRSREVARENTIARTPVKSVHNDYTETSGPQRIKDLKSEQAGDDRGRRYCFINVWKPITRVVEESPLAVCDAQSMVPDDFIPTALRYRDRDGEVYSVRHNPNHRWHYLPQMTPQDVLFLKCFDSSRDIKARFTAHSAFRDPTSPKGAKARESIEVRTVAFFD